MFRVRIRVPIASVALLLGITLSGCSSGSPVSYAPAAYGEAGHCYYVDSPAEATALLAAGLCPAGWVAYPAPLAWQESYYSYYSSPAYYNVFVPVATRTVYISHETTFHTTYSSQIATASKTATYKGSNGKTVTGPNTAKLKFGSGSGSTTSKGGGSLRNGSAGGTTGGSKSSGGTTGGAKTTTGGTSGGSLRGGRK